MAKKVFKSILKIIIFVLVYLFQIYVGNNNTLFGAVGNLPLMAVVLVTLMETNIVAYATAVICGLVSDVLFATIPCKYLVIYIMVTAVLIGLKKMYKQDSKMAIIIFSTLATCISGMFMYVFNIAVTGQFVNVFAFILLVLKECIVNICLAFLVYLAFKLCNKEG